jgi:hypothetical protein
VTIGAIAATSTTVVFAVVSLILGWASVRTHGEWLNMRAKADRSLAIGDERGHAAARMHASLLRRQVRARWLATLSSLAVMVVSAGLATVG